jgi:hypothetical protein
VRKLLNALDKVQDWDTTRVGDAMDAVESALLAAPEAVGVTDEAVEDAAETIYESMRLAHRQPHKGETPKWDRLGNSLMQAEARGCARAVLSRYGTVHPTPVPVGERLPGASDCMANPRNGEGLWCWGWVQHDPSKFTGRWRMIRLDWLTDEATHWLPHWALPLPEAQS